MPERWAAWSCAFVAAGASCTAWVAWLTAETTQALALAIAIHLAGALLTARASIPARRGLALALGVAVPALGPFAALAGTVQGRGGRDLLHDPREIAKPTNGTELALSLTRALPPWEAVMSSNPDVRRAALATLSQRATSADVEILRWARTRCEGEIALEVALAFDEASERFDRLASRARAAAEEDRSYMAAAQAFQILVEGIHSGIFDERVTSRLAVEARKYYDAAIAADSLRARELLVARAHLELADRNPAVALELLVPLIGDDSSTVEVDALYKQAAFAARRFDLPLGPEPRRKALAD